MVDRTRPGASASLLAADVDRSRAALGSVPVGERTRPIVDRFVVFAEDGFGVQRLADVTAAVAESFVRAPHADLLTPSVASMHWRRMALRVLFRAARAAGVASHDPTVDIVLPPRLSVAVRPLSDDEVELGRVTAQWSVGTRYAAVWALAEATCRSSELPHITAADLDLDATSVRIHGGKRTLERVGRLGEWAVPHLARRAVEVEAGHSLLYAGNDPCGAGQVSCSRAVIEVLTRAGLNRDRSVRPGSVAGWAGRKVFDETGRIDEAARALGVRNLDQAARIIALDWGGDRR